MSRDERNGKSAKTAGNGKPPSPDSSSSHPIIAPRGDYQTLHSFHKAEVVYDLTFRFAHKYLAKGDRTFDQMIQAARSGKKNLLEGSRAALTSKETEIKLTSVARASLEAAYRKLRLLVREEVTQLRRVGKTLPPVSTRPMRDAVLA